MRNNSSKFYLNDTIAANYERRRFESIGGKALNAIELAAVQELIAPGHYQRVLELGCGTGRLTNFILDNYDFYVVSIDYSFSMLRKAVRGKKRVSFVAADALRLPLKQDSFDGCVSLRLCHHLDKDALFDLFSNLTHILKKDGTIIFNTTNIFSLAILGAWTRFYKKKYAAQCFLNPRSMVSLLNTLGFSLTEKKRILFVPSFVYRKIKNKTLLWVVNKVNSILEAAFPSCASMIIWKAALTGDRR